MYNPYTDVHITIVLKIKINLLKKSWTSSFIYLFIIQGLVFDADFGS